MLIDVIVNRRRNKIATTKLLLYQMHYTSNKKNCFYNQYVKIYISLSVARLNVNNLIINSLIICRIKIMKIKN